jgi:uncharacterized protein (TIGR00661 family)
MIPYASEYLITAFFSARLRRKHAAVVPPILRKEVLTAGARAGGYALVYVTSPSEELSGLLKRIRQSFVCYYGFGRAGRQDANLVFKKPSLTAFLEDLAECQAVIANSGFSLICEALYLGKPYLAIPVRHQFEQVLNAYYVDKMGYGTTGTS